MVAILESISGHDFGLDYQYSYGGLEFGNYLELIWMVILLK